MNWKEFLDKVEKTFKFNCDDLKVDFGEIWREFKK